MLILPQTEAIGPHEAEVIRDFVMSGGTVIADVRPGLYDHHCKPLARGLLDDLFGIERTGNLEAVSAEGAVHGAPPDDRRAAKRLGLKAAVAVAEPPSHPGPPWRSSDGSAIPRLYLPVGEATPSPEGLGWATPCQRDLATSLGNRALAVSLARVQVDPAVRAGLEHGHSCPCGPGKSAWAPAVAVAGDLATNGGQPMGSAGDAPLCIINQVGRGRAVLLNLTMSSFPEISDPDTPPAAADFAAALLASAGVEPAVAVTDAAGRPVRDTEVIRWKGRGVDFVTLFGGKDEMVQVTLPRARHVYDLRERAYRGLQDTFAVHKLPTRATFVALSPLKLSAPQATLSANRIDRGERLTVRRSYAPSRARHAVRVRVYGPDGKHAEWFDQVAVVDPQGAEVTLPIACNDPTGAWTIRATDLCTDEAAEARFVVQ